MKLNVKRYFYNNDGSEVPAEKATWAEDLYTSPNGTVMERRQFYTDQYAPTGRLLLS